MRVHHNPLINGYLRVLKTNNKGESERLFVETGACDGDNNRRSAPPSNTGGTENHSKFTKVSFYAAFNQFAIY